MSESEILTSMDITGNNRKFRWFGFWGKRRNLQAVSNHTGYQLVINEARIKPILTDFSTILLSCNYHHNNWGHSESNFKISGSNLGSEAWPSPQGSVHLIVHRVQVLWKGHPKTWTWFQFWKGMENNSINNPFIKVNLVPMIQNLESHWSNQILTSQMTWI